MQRFLPRGLARLDVGVIAFLIATSVAGQTPVHPRVLVLIDTSGSMTRHLTDNCDTGGEGGDPLLTFSDASGSVFGLYLGLPGPVDPSTCLVPCSSLIPDGQNSRLWAAKVAFRNVLNSTTKIDWGLMRYSGTSCPIVGTFQPHTCTTFSNCVSGNCQLGVCHATNSFGCAPGEVLMNGVCGTDANLCRSAIGSSYQEANCTTTRTLPITYIGGSGTSAIAGTGPCATFQTCATDADCTGNLAGRCAVLGSGPAKVCKGGVAGASCPPNYVAVAGRCMYNLACQSIGGVVLADPAAANSALTALPYIDGREDYRPNGLGQPTNPELRADGLTPLAGAIRTATTWYKSIVAANADPSIACRPYATVLIVDGPDNCETGSTISGPTAAAQGFVFATAVGAANLNSVHIIALGFAAPDATLDSLAHAGGTTTHYVTSEAQIESVLNSIAASLVPAASVSGSTTVCTNGTAGTATSTNGTAWGYRTQSGGAVTAISGATGSTYLIKGSDFPGAGTFFLVDGSCNFGSLSDEITITVVLPPSATVTAPSQIVAGRTGAASVSNAGAGASYAWSVSGATFTGQGTASIGFTAGSSGSVGLSVTIQSSAGCISTGTRTVAIIPPFTDDPLVPGSTVVKAAHLAEVRDSVNALRARAGLGALGWTDAAVPGLVIKALHIIELRDALTPALTALGMTATYSDAHLGPGTTVKAIDIQEIRDYTR